MTALLDMNTSPAEPEQVDRKPAMRFQYASGSRPLDGFTIKRGVGRGGFGEVYFAVSDAGKEVALKLIRRNLEVELRGVTHCLNLKHPNLIDVYDIRTDEHDDRWVIMEYVSGASLEDVIARYPDGMPHDMALHWFEGMCAGVAYLHDHGIVHRDLKPANIFLDEGRVKIGDYGLSKFISCSRRSGQTESVGTVHYMAPEIANGRYGREIDSYALGIILFEMLTGHVPFEGESVGEVLMKHLTAEPDLSRLDEPFREVVRGAMAKDPERRIDSAAEMASMLRGAARATDPSSPVERAAAYNPPPRAPRSESPWLDSDPGPAPSLSPGLPPESPRRPPGGWREFVHRQPDPLAEGVRRGWRAMVQELNFSSWHPMLRTLCIVGLVFAVIGAMPLWFVIGVTTGLAYFAYTLLRVVLQAVTLPPASPGPGQDPPYAARFTPAPPPPAPPTFAPQAPVSAAAATPASGVRPSALAATLPHTPNRRWRGRRGQGTWRHAAYQELALRPLRVRVSTLLASLLAAAVIAPIASLLVCLFSASPFHTELFLWFSVVATLGSWAIMIPAQLAEGRVEDQAPMRFIQLLAGALVGALAWCVAESMYLRLPASHELGLSPRESLLAELFRWNNDILAQEYNAGSVELPLPMYAAYFAFLFVLLRWWKLGEWTRSTRVSVWTLAWCGLAAGFLGLVWWFPQPAGVMAAVVISFTVQLASPWLSPARRKEMANPALA